MSRSYKEAAAQKRKTIRAQQSKSFPAATSFSNKKES